MNKKGTHAVVGIWNLADGFVEEQEGGLEKEVLPLVRQFPGFVAGYWLADRTTHRSYSFILMEDEEAARRFKATVEGNPLGREKVGVSNESLAIVELVAEAAP